MTIFTGLPVSSARNSWIALGMIRADTVGSAPILSGGPLLVCARETLSMPCWIAATLAPAWRRKTSP